MKTNREILESCEYPKAVLDQMTDEECEGEVEVLGLSRFIETESESDQ